MSRAQKLTQEEWLEIEVDLTEFEQRVCSMMLEAGSLYSSIQSTQKLQLEVLGESLYTEMFQDKVKALYFPEEVAAEGGAKSKKTEKKEKEKAKKGGKPGSKNAKKGKNDIYDKYMKSEKKKKVEELFQDIVKAKADSLFRQKNFGFSTNVLEFKLLSFLVLAKLVKGREEWIYEIIIGLKKCLRVYEGFRGKLHFSENEQDFEEAVSPTFFDQIKKFMGDLAESNVFSMRITFLKYPKLVYHTIFDNYFESIKLRPYDSQRELLRSIRNYYLDRNSWENNKGLLVFYKAMIGSGKTTVSIALASMVKQLRAERPIFDKLQVIFCCGLTQIRIQVGQLLFNSLDFDKISFAIVSSTEDGHIILRNHFSCKTEKYPLIMITDLETTLLLLQKKTDQKYILFLDEPIIDADQTPCPITKTFFQIMKNAPNLTILSSATLPNPENLPSLVGMFRKKYENSDIFTIFSEPAKVAQQIYVNLSEKYYPHNGCRNAEELRQVLNSVRSNPFLARLYTGPSIYIFEEKLKKNGLLNPLSKGIEEKFSDPKNMNQRYVQEYAFELLETLLENGNDKIIEEFCSTDIEKMFSEGYRKKEAEDEEEEVGLIEKPEEEQGMNEEEIGKKEEVFEEIIEMKKSEENKNQIQNLEICGLKINELATKKAHLFIGGCLIATPNPIDFARKAFGHFVSKVSLKDLLKDYQKQKDSFEAEFERLEEIKNEEERLKKKSAYENENAPRILFPDFMKINLREHLLKYCDLEKPEFVGYRKDFLLDNLVFKIEEDLNLMLFSGVGVFESDKIFNEEYNKTIRSKAKFGELAYLISNKDILYGANYPLNNVIVDDSFAGIYSINTVFQTMGRAGRIGQAWKSNCFLGPQITQKLDNFILESNKPGYLSEEAKNIERLIHEDFGEMRIGGDIVVKMRKIAIFFDATSLDGVYSMVLAAFFYMQKLQKYYKQAMSDVDFFEIVRFVPLDYLEEIGSLKEVTTAYFLGVFPLRFSNGNDVMGGCRKVVYIDHRQFNKKKFADFRKEFEAWRGPESETKFIEIFDKEASSQIAVNYFKNKALKKGLIEADFKLVFPNYIKKSYNQPMNLQFFNAAVKMISGVEMNYENKVPEILSCMVEKMMGYLEKCGPSFKMLWKVASLKLEQIKGKATIKHSIVLNKCNLMIEEHACILETPTKFGPFLALYKVPISYYKYRNLIRDMLMQKSSSMKLKSVAVVSWISYKTKENVLITIHSNEKSFSCGEFAESFEGLGEKNDAEFMMSRKEFASWKFDRVAK